MAKHTTIWKSYGMYPLKEMEQEEKSCKEFLSEAYPEIEQTEENVTQVIYDHIDMYFDAETSNLDKQLDGRILAIASMGLWNGRKSGYKILGNNLNEVLTSSIGCDEKEVYCDSYNVYAEGYHHDGKNYVEFREIREDRNIENLLDKIYSGKEVTRREMNYYTRSLRPYIKSIYGI
jgi:hypothetical protein